MSDPITRLNAALEGRYRIERELGRCRCFRYGTFIALVTLSLSRCGGSDAPGPTGPSGPTTSAPSVTTSSLPDGLVGESYGQTLAAMGGDSSYSWTI